MLFPASQPRPWSRSAARHWRAPVASTDARHQPTHHQTPTQCNGASSMQRRVWLLLLLCCRRCCCFNCHAAACRCYTAAFNAWPLRKCRRCLWHMRLEKEAKGEEHQEGVDAGQGQKKVSVGESRWREGRGGAWACVGMRVSRRAPGGRAHYLSLIAHCPAPI